MIHQEFFFCWIKRKVLSLDVHDQITLNLYDAAVGVESGHSAVFDSIR